MTLKSQTLASVYGYAVSTATMFLAAKMNCGLVFTIDETIQTAISAFQHMCLKELTAEDIWFFLSHSAFGVVDFACVLFPSNSSFLLLKH